MDAMNKEQLEEKVNPDYVEGTAEIANMLEELPEPARQAMVDAMVKFILFQG